MTENPQVLGGLTRANVVWAFTTFEASNWHPLTWLSLMVDIELGGPDPRVFHLTNVVLHIANTVLLFHLLVVMTGSRSRGAFVAALFAVHPLHVESVAWIAERKDVLSTLWWLLTTLAYVSYAARPGGLRYAWVVAAFALGLMSKPMLVTLPLVLLLLDYWPLGRLSDRGATATSVGRLLLEKLPLCVMSAASCWVTLHAQWSVVGSSEQFPLAVRLANAAVSYTWYIWQLLAKLITK